MPKNLPDHWLWTEASRASRAGHHHHAWASPLRVLMKVAIKEAGKRMRELCSAAPHYTRCLQKDLAHKWFVLSGSYMILRPCTDRYIYIYSYIFILLVFIIHIGRAPPFIKGHKINGHRRRRGGPPRAVGGGLLFCFVLFVACCSHYWGAPQMMRLWPHAPKGWEYSNRAEYKIPL